MDNGESEGTVGHLVRVRGRGGGRVRARWWR